MKPLLFVTGHAPPSRIEPFRMLAEREQAVFALFGGRAKHALREPDELSFPHRRPRQREVYALAASGEYRAVVCGTGGRVALPAAYLGARRARVPFVLWASLWAHPGGPAGLAGYLPLRRIYRRADAVVTYGEHVSAYVRERGARNVHVAPQAVDNDFWGAEGKPRRQAAFQAVFSGRLVREKGVGELLDAWRRAALPDSALLLLGQGPLDGARSEGVVGAGAQTAANVRDFYAGADVVVLPSLPTRTFREPWGLVVNEAFNQGVPVIASDAVGAVAGGLVRDERNGLVVPAGDPDALAGALRRLHAEPELRARLGAAAREDVRAYTFEAWVEGFERTLATVAASAL